MHVRLLKWGLGTCKFNGVLLKINKYDPPQNFRNQLNWL